MNLGDILPVFDGEDQSGNTIKSSDYMKKALVVFFYPADFTPTCTKEACGFRDNYKKFLAHDCEIIGVSSNSEKSHSKFSNHYNLQYPLLVDKKGILSKKFKLKKSLGLIPNRATFIFKNGVLIGKHKGLFEADYHIKKSLESLKKNNK